MSIKNSQKGSIETSTIAAMAIIAAMVAAVSIYATIKYYETPTNTPPIAVITPKLTLSATPTPIPVVNQETVGWKIYNWNNLEFKYPPTWTVEKSYYRSAAQQAQGIAPENVGVSIYPDIFKRGNIYINIGGSQVNCNPSQNHTKCSYISSIANYIYTDSDDIGIRNTFDQILSTLKFTGNNETADWQTYRNDKYRFEIKYPEGICLDNKDDKFEALFEDCKWKDQNIHNPIVGIETIDTNLSFRGWLDKNGTAKSIFDETSPCKDCLYYSVSEKKNIYISGGVPALQFNSSAVSDSSLNTIVKSPVRDNILLNIIKVDSGIGTFPDEVYKQMLSTFKFTE